MDERLLVWLEWLYRHKGRVIGISLGLIFGWMSIHYGVIRTVFVGLCLTVGFFVGHRIDHKESWEELIDRILPKRSSRFR